MHENPPLTAQPLAPQGQPIRHPMYLVLAMCVVVLGGMVGTHLLDDMTNVVGWVMVLLYLWSSIWTLRFWWTRAEPDPRLFPTAFVAVVAAAGHLLSIR